MARHLTGNVFDDLMIKNPSADMDQKLKCIESKLKREKLSALEATKLFHTAVSTLENGKELYPASIKYFEWLLRHLLSDGITLPGGTQVITHPYVQMGDGLKWSTSNLGAAKPEDFGDYIAWGEVETYYATLDPLTWKSGKEGGYDFKTNRYYRKKYTVEDGKAVLEKEDDAAYANWKGTWRMPTLQEWNRLLDKNDFAWDYTSRGGVRGYTVTSKVKGYEGNQIFLPAAGCIVYSNRTEATMGCYWSSSVFPENERYESSDLYAKCLRFEEGHIVTSHGGRGDGFCIRPVSI